MKPLLLAAALMLAAQAGAQPTLTATNSFPVVGDLNYRLYNYTNFNSGGSGTGQLWDFSSQNYMVLDSPALFTDCTAPYVSCSSWPGTNLVGNYGTTIHTLAQQRQFYTVSGSGVLFRGETLPGSYMDQYSQPRELLRFPFTYGNSFTSAWQRTGVTTGINGNIAIHGAGWDTVTADATGTIKTPAGTYTNVLRIKRVCTRYDTMGTGTSMTATISHVLEYEWRDANLRDAVYRSSQITVGSNPPENRSSYYLPPSPNGVAATTGSTPFIALTPNPVAASSRIAVQVGTGAATTITLQLMDMTGRLLRRLPPAAFAAGTTGRLYLDTEGLAAGQYVLQAQADGIALPVYRVVVLP